MLHVLNYCALCTLVCFDKTLTETNSGRKAFLCLSGYSLTSWKPGQEVKAEPAGRNWSGDQGGGCWHGVVLLFPRFKKSPSVFSCRRHVEGRDLEDSLFAFVELDFRKSALTPTSCLSVYSMQKKIYCVCFRATSVGCRNFLENKINTVGKL